MLALGDVERPVYPRSAVKALQALPLVESGAADRYGLGHEELALACASHSGEPGHVATATRMLARPGSTPARSNAARTGRSTSRRRRRWRAAAARRRRAPQQLLGQARGLSLRRLRASTPTTRDYVEPTHPVQRVVRRTLEDLTGATLSQDVCAIDGCSVPTWAMPLAALARGFARFGTGLGLTPERAKAAARLRDACAAHPWHVGGTGRFCTRDHAALRRARAS